MAFFQTLFHYGKDTGGQRVVGNVFCHHTSRRDDASVADGHTRTDNHSSSQPAVLADDDGIGRFFFFPAFHVVHRVLGGIEQAVWFNERMLPDADIPGIEHGAVAVDEHIFRQLDVRAVVVMERRQMEELSGMSGISSLSVFR